MAFYLFDLDGTLALNSPRQHFVNPGVEKECPRCAGMGWMLTGVKLVVDCDKCETTGKIMWKDWKSFFTDCDKDAVNHPIFDLMIKLWGSGHEVEIWSGRTDSVREKTLQWLINLGIDEGNADKLLRRMRKEGDYTPDHILKASWLKEHRESGRKDPLIVFDDRDSVVAMWREHGLCCVQVAPGDF